LGRLARSARTAKPANLAALQEPRRTATLAALFQTLEATALDDAVELAVGAPDHPPVRPPGVLDRGQRGHCPGPAVSGQQRLDAVERCQHQVDRALGELATGLTGHERDLTPLLPALPALLAQLQAYRQEFGLRSACLLLANPYGPGYHLDLEDSDVIPALIRKCAEARQGGAPAVTVWGTGRVRREFLHVDDMADACVFLMQKWNSSDIVNIGCGEDVSIGELAAMVSEVVGYQGTIQYDTSKPDGTPRKLLDVSRLKSLGWAPTIGLSDGIARTYGWYVGQLSPV